MTWRRTEIDYLHDEEGLPFGGVYRSPASSTNPTYFTLITSDRGDTLELCDANGAAFCAYRYDAWGAPQGEGSYATGIWTQGTTLVNSTLAGQIAARQVLRYASYVFDSESALCYCSARFYDPATRQWTTGDPAKADGEESAYQYCGGEPVGHTDLSGRRTKRRTYPFRVTHNTADVDTSSWYAEVTVKYQEEDNRHWTVTFVGWNNYDISWVEAFSDYSWAGVWEYRKSLPGWACVDYETWGTMKMTYPASWGEYNWAWETAEQSTRKWYWKKGEKRAATKVDFYEHVTCIWGSQVFSGYFAGVIKLPKA